jgi:hypothetical protein
MDIVELEQECTYNEKEEILSEGEGCVKRNSDTGTCTDVLKSGNHYTTNYGFRSECGKKHASLLNPRKRN